LCECGLEMSRLSIFGRHWPITRCAPMHKSRCSVEVKIASSICPQTSSIGWLVGCKCVRRIYCPGKKSAGYVSRTYRLESAACDPFVATVACAFHRSDLFSKDYCNRKVRISIIPVEMRRRQRSVWCKY